MAEKTLRTRIALLYKSYSEWQAVKNTFIPLKGEVCICEVPAAAGAVVNEPAVLIKVGDGVKTWEQLSWNSALAADVYAWAKKENLEWIDLSEDFKAQLDQYISQKSPDRQYQIIADSEIENKWKLQTRIGEGAWADATGVIDLSTTIANLEAAIDAEEARAKAEEAKKVDKVITSASGTARIFNEADGGGAKFEHADGSEAFVGVNNGGVDGMMAQIYADVMENGAWKGSRINVYHNGIYYVSKANQAAGMAKNAPEMEIATKGDIAALGKVLRFRGIFDSLAEVTNPEHGDVAIVGNKEYIYVVTGSLGEWKEFGDVTEYATKAELDAAKVELGTLIGAEETRAKAAEEALDAKIDAAAEAAQAYIDEKIADEAAARATEDAKKVDKELRGTAGKSLIFNEADGGGSKFEGSNGVNAYVGTHDNIGGEIGTQIYVDKADGSGSTIIDVTQNGAYYNKGPVKPGVQRDVEAQEIAVKGDIAALDAELATIAKTGNVNDLVQDAGDVLILDCNI